MITKEQHAALESLGLTADDINEDDISEAGRIWVRTPSGGEALIDLDGSIE